MTTTQNLIEQLRAMVALTNEAPRIPALPRALATEAADRLSELFVEIAEVDAEIAHLRELRRVSFIQMLAILRQNGDRLEIYNSSITDVDPLSDTIIQTRNDANDSVVLERRAHDKGEPKP